MPKPANVCSNKNASSASSSATRINALSFIAAKIRTKREATTVNAFAQKAHVTLCRCTSVICCDSACAWALRFATVHRQFFGETNRRAHAGRIRNAMPGDVVCRAVIRRGSNKRKSECPVHAIFTSHHFQRHQALVM